MPAPDSLDTRLTPAGVQMVRAQLIHLAEQLAEAGEPADQIVSDARAGIAQAVRRHERSGR